MPISKYLLAQLNLESVALEAKQFKVLQSNLIDARKELSKTNTWGKLQFQGALNDTIDNLNYQLARDFDVKLIYEQGSETGRLITAQAAQIPDNSNFWQWKPRLPLVALAQETDLYERLIRNMTDDLRKDILKANQIGLALGEGVGEIQNRILGTGLQGLKGKDGVFRSATQRSETIARTVSNSLLNKGAMATYEQVHFLSPELELKKQWVTVSDNRTSKRCLSLSNQIRDVYDNFVAADGWSGNTPPSHPNCRARIVSVTKKYSNNLESRWANNGGEKLTVRGLSQGL